MQVRDSGTAMRKGTPELLVPAGGREQLEAALIYGADAVYMGGPELSLRTACDGFTAEELAQGVQDAHRAGVRVYYCLNAMPYDKQLGAVEAMLERLPELGVDGLIAADPGVIWLARKQYPSVPIHLSTQAHSVNGAAVSFWREVGVERINLARELDARAIRELVRAFPDMEFEAFVHGAMCLALSGHCLLSAWVNNRPANQGRCTQPCRFEYRGVGLSASSFSGLTLSVEERKRAGEPLWDIREGEAFSGFWAPQDVCLLRYVGWLANNGVRALKLEGRTKSGGYVAQVADVYRTALDRHAGVAAVPQGEGRAASNPSPEDLLTELFHTASRPLSTGFFLPRRKVEPQPEGFLARPVVARLREAVGPGSWRVQVRSPWLASQDAAVLVPGMHRPELVAGKYALENHRGERVDRLHPGMEGVLHCEAEGLAAGLYIRA